MANMETMSRCERFEVMREYIEPFVHRHLEPLTAEESEAQRIRRVGKLYEIFEKPNLSGTDERYLHKHPIVKNPFACMEDLFLFRVTPTELYSLATRFIKEETSIWSRSRAALDPDPKPLPGFSELGIPVRNERLYGSIDDMRLELATYEAEFALAPIPKSVKDLFERAVDVRDHGHREDWIAEINGYD